MEFTVCRRKSDGSPEESWPMALTPGFPLDACCVLSAAGFWRLTGGLGVACGCGLAAGAEGWWGTVITGGGRSVGDGSGLGGGASTMGGARGSTWVWPVL